MKRLFVALITLAATVQAGPAVSAPDSGNSPVVEFCRTLVLPDVPQANLGECVSYVNANDENGFPAHACDGLLEIEPELFYQIYESFSDCVRTMKQQ